MEVGDSLVQRIPTYVNNFTTGISDGLWQSCVMRVTGKDSWWGEIKIWILAFQVKIILKERYKFMRWGSDQGALPGAAATAVYDGEGEGLQPGSA